MDAIKPVPIEIPPPCDEAALLAFYLEGIPLVQIARALKVGIPTVLDFVRGKEVRECIEQYEECIEQQTRLFALASRIPAMSTLREVCASEGSLAERRRAASDLLRQSRAANKPAKGRRFARTLHKTPNPEAFHPKPDIRQMPDIVLTPDASVGPGFDSPPEISPPIARSEVLFESQSIEHASDPAPLTTPSAPDSSAPAASTLASREPSQPTTHQSEPEDSAPDADPVAHQSTARAAANLAPPRIDALVSSPPPIPSPFDIISPGELSSPLPDAIPVAIPAAIPFAA